MDWKVYETPIYVAETGKWKVTVKDINDKVLEVKEFNSKGEAEEVLKGEVTRVTNSLENNKETTNRVEKKRKTENKPQTAKEVFDNQATVLEKKLADMGANIASQSNNSNTVLPNDLPPAGYTNTPIGGKSLDEISKMLEEETEEKIAQFKEDYEAKKAAHIAKAKSALESIGKLYLGENLFKKSEYAKYKTEIGAMGLAPLMMQIDVAQEAIFKLSQYITLGATNSRLFEVLANLQKTLTDIIKYNHEFFVDAEESIKQLREDILNGLAPGMEDLPDNSAEQPALESGQQPGSMKFLPNRKELISELNVLMVEVHSFMKIPSKNERLKQDVDDIDFVEVNEHDKDKEEDNLPIDENHGLSSM